MNSFIIFLALFGGVFGHHDKMSDCGPFQEYSECGSRCTESCNWDKNTFCTLGCDVGYFCQKGHKRDHNDRCVLEKDCPCHDRKNEIYKECGSACGDGCFDHADICPDMCKSGCSCKPGFARNNGICIPAHECPPCSKGEVYKNDTNKCLDSCFGTKNCLEIKIAGCYCPDGYKRDFNGTCIRKQECPSSAPACSEPFEEFQLNGVKCQDNCDKALVRCASNPEPGCYCQEGFARDLDNKKCRPYDATNPKGCKRCGENAEWVNCATEPCDANCPDIVNKQKCQIVNKKCSNECRCKKGFARQTKDRASACVPISTCTRCASPHCNKSHEIGK